VDIASNTGRVYDTVIFDVDIIADMDGEKGEASLKLLVGRTNYYPLAYNAVTADFDGGQVTTYYAVLENNCTAL